MGVGGGPDEPPGMAGWEEDAGIPGGTPGGRLNVAAVEQGRTKVCAR